MMVPSSPVCCEDLRYLIDVKGLGLCLAHKNFYFYGNSFQKTLSQLLLLDVH